MTIVNRLWEVAGDGLVLETWLPNMGPFLLVDELGMSLACTTLRFYFRKGRHAEHLKWDSMMKEPTAWANIYGEVSLGMEDTIYLRYRRILTSTACTTRSPWFGKLMKG